jgi:large subunit ribosomal protein L35
MPKLKTHKGARGRFHLTGSGKLMRTKCGKSHFRRRKAPSAKRLYDETIPVAPADRKRVLRLLGYK